MFYSNEITVAASTTESSPSSTIVKASRGVIRKVIFQPRPGHNALLHVKVFYHEHQIAPVSRDEDLHGDTFPVEYEEYEELFIPPYELKVVAWNDDDTYAHTFDISFAILPQRVVEPPDLGRIFRDIVGLLSPRRMFGGG